MRANRYGKKAGSGDKWKKCYPLQENSKIGGLVVHSKKEIPADHGVHLVDYQAVHVELFSTGSTSLKENTKRVLEKTDL